MNKTQAQKLEWKLIAINGDLRKAKRSNQLDSMVILDKVVLEITEAILFVRENK